MNPTVDNETNIS